MLLILVVLISSIPRQIKTEQEHQCYAEVKSPYVYFASFTSYVSSRGSEINIPKNCSPIYVWGIIRHGTRYPTSKNHIVKLKKELHKMRDQIILNHKSGRGNLCGKDIENLKKWNMGLTPDLTSELTPQGIKDMIILAKQVKETFPTLCKSQSKNLFETSDTNRTRDSAIAFTNELIGTNFTTIQGNNITQDDEFLQLYQHCPNYSKLTNIDWLLEERNAFKTSAVWQKMVAEISLRLGFLQPLSYDSIMLLYNICAYENAWFINTKPPFCAAFVTEDLKVIEYFLDMILYYRKGYGNTYPNEKMGCPIVRDMMLSLTNAAENVGNFRKGKFLFSHSEAVMPTMIKLGLHKDKEPLRLGNYQRLSERRQWRSFLFDSFASNILAVLHKCPTESGWQNVVAFHQNEHSVSIPLCNSNPCTLEELQHIFEDVFDVNRCNTDFCKLPKSSQQSSARHSCHFSLKLIATICSLFLYFELK